MAQTINIGIDTFNPCYIDYLDNHNRINVFYGGAGSGKSIFVAQRAIYRCLKEPYYRLLFCRKVANTIRNSQFLLFKDLITQFGLTPLFTIKETTMEIACKNGNIMMSAGLDDVERLKSIQEVTDIWMEEATEFTKNDLMQLNLRLRTKKAKYNQITLTFNPVTSENWIYNSFFVLKEFEADILKTTYLDNNYLPNEYKEQLSKLQFADENYYKVYALGEWGGQVKGAIYPTWQLCDSLPDGGEIIYGIDFGFNNPTAVVKVCIKDGAIYCQQCIYKSGLTNSDLINELAKLSIGRSVIYGDAAEPQRIEEIYRAGYNIKPADKGQGSVKKGIDSVKSRTLYITSDSSDVIKEIRNYKWVEDKNGNTFDEPVKFLDHCFVGDTLIETINGGVKIKDIKEGDLVLTSNGYKRVLIKWDNGVQQVNKYSMQSDINVVSLCGTENHLIKSDNQWTKISKLKSGMTINLINHSTEKTLNYNPKKGILIMEKQRCIFLFMNFLMAKFLKVIMYIIKILIHGIMKLQTLNLFNRQNTCRNTEKNERVKMWSGLRIFKRKELLQQSIGIGRKMAESGIANTQKNNGLINCLQLANAWCAEMIIQLHCHVLVNTATQIVKLKHIEVGESWNERVYDLTVMDAHEYFANGILVHNCLDAIRYAVHSHLVKPSGKYSIR